MILLDYLIGDYQSAIAHDESVAGADLTDLTFRMFTGDVTFRVNGSSFDARWGWIPLLDFAVQLYDSVRALSKSGEACVSFTENTDYIKFRRTNDHVAISASYSSATAELPVLDLEIAATQFLKRLLADLSQRWPSIRNNPLFLAIEEAIVSQDSFSIEQVLMDVSKRLRCQE